MSSAMLRYVFMELNHADQLAALFFFRGVDDH